jgi:hypothetical protein
MAISNASRKQVLIIGDFNFPNINWVTNESYTASPEIRDLIMDNYLVQHVKSPTERKLYFRFCVNIRRWIRWRLLSIWEIVIIT